MDVALYLGWLGGIILTHNDACELAGIQLDPFHLLSPFFLSLLSFFHCTYLPSISSNSSHSSSIAPVQSWDKSAQEADNSFHKSPPACVKGS